MKKIQIFALVALAALVAVSCSKSSKSIPTSDGPVCQTLKVSIDCELNEDIFNNFDIVLTTKDFNGKVESQPLNSASHSLTFTKEDANIDGDKDMWPFLLGVNVAKKENADIQKTSYNPQFKFQCYAEFFDAEGKELNTGSGDGTNKSSIIFKDYSKESSISSFEAFESFIGRLNEKEQTYSFYRSKSALSGEYFFSWSKPKQ